MCKIIVLRKLDGKLKLKQRKAVDLNLAFFLVYAKQVAGLVRDLWIHVSLIKL
jgi:hypothetical protein